MTGALLMTQTLPTIVGAAVVTRALDIIPVRTARDRGGRLVGATHYHYKGKTRRGISHKHPGGQVSHMHRGLPGYGRNRKSLRR